MSASLRIYVETSALAMLLTNHETTDDLVTWLDSTTADLVSSDLLETELRRVGHREGLSQFDVSRCLAGVALAELTRVAFRGAGLLSMPYLRSLDALHLQCALLMEADAILTYDRRLADAAREVGLKVISPGADI